jgi:hypothetical protein
MKQFKFASRSFLIALCCILTFTMVGSAASTTKVLSTNYTLVNMSGEDAVVSVEYFKDDGTTWTADADKTNFTVDANYGQMVVAQYFDNTLSSGKGSAIVSSSQPLGAVVTIQARAPQVPTNGAYIGFDQTSDKYYVPLVMRKRATANGLGNTQIMIQNTGSAPITVDVQFIASASGLSDFLKSDIRIPAYSTYYYDVEEEAATNLSNGWIGSAVVTADSGAQIAVVVNMFTGDHGLQTINAFPASMAGTSWAVPQFASRLPNSFNTPINVQNVSGSTINAGDIDLNCKPAEGFSGEITTSNVTDVPNNATYGFNPVTDTTNFPDNWQGACTITASGNVVAFVTLRRPGATNEISAYEAFPATNTNTTVVIPLMAKRLANGFSTAAVIMNLDLVNEANVTLTYTRAAGITVGAATYTFNATILPGGNISQNLRLATEPASISMPDGWQGTLVIEPQSGQPARPIIAYVALTNLNASSGDTQMAHDAFTQP